MYNYYKSKEGLLREIFQDGIKKITALIEPDADGVLTKEAFRYLIEEAFRTIAENRIFWSLYFSVIPQPGVMKIVRKEISKIYKDLYKILGTYFVNMGYQDPESEAMLFGSMLDGISINYVLNPDFYPLEKVKKKLIDIDLEK